MLLYKYVSLEALRKILETNSLGFTRLSDFNDPFDIPVAPPVPPGEKELGIASLFRGEMKSWIYENFYGALSLTRSPENKLMWSHYADEHRGAVIEIDAPKAKFNCLSKNFIPAFAGSVIYSSIPQMNRYHSDFSTIIKVGKSHDFHVDHLEKLQRLFLSKPLDWAYEEEVRVVKCLEGKPDKLEEKEFSNKSGEFNAIQIGDRKMTYCFKMPEGSIRSVILGSRAKNKLDDIRSMCANDVFISVAELSQRTFTINTGIKENHLKIARDEEKKMILKGEILYTR